jgi:hypothetical protein
LPTDRTLRHAKLFCGFGKTHQTRHGFKSTQGIQRGDFAGHLDPGMNLTHFNYALISIEYFINL